MTVTREAAPDVVAKPGDDMMLDLSTIEGIDLNAEIPCVGLRYINHTCPSAATADVIVATHTSRNRYPACWECFYDFHDDPQTRCALTHEIEPGSVHYRIVEVLR